MKGIQVRVHARTHAHAEGRGGLVGWRVRGWFGQPDVRLRLTSRSTQNTRDMARAAAVTRDKAHLMIMVARAIIMGLSRVA